MPTNHEGSLVDLDDRLRHFSRHAFVSLANDLARCFVCGISRADCTFNEEHIIPDWVLSRFSMHSRHITLPNGHQSMYGRYRIRCCINCNSLLGKEVEAPLSKILNGTFSEVAAKLQESAPSLLYQWLCLLFIKCHLKDREIRVSPDTRVASDPVGSLYDWDGLHHIHAVARAAHSGAHIDDSVIGTTFIFPMRESNEPFDFGDLSDYSTISVRLGPIGIAAVLNDCRAVKHLVSGYFSHIKGPLSPIQLREVAARLAYGNTLLHQRPRFWSELHEGTLTIRSMPANPWPIPPVNRTDLGAILVGACEPLLRRSQTPDIEKKIDQLGGGEIQFLYHDDGSFIVD